MKWALYDLRQNTPSFDIFTFVQYAKYYGAEGIWFLPGYKGSGHLGGNKGERWRMKTLVIPAVEMYGFAWKLEPMPADVKVVYPLKNEGRNSFKPPIYRDSHKWSASWFEERKPQPVPITIPQESLDRVNDKFKGKKPVVVVTRKQGYEDYRNSNLDWWTWAKDHDAVLVEDYSAENPISLADRLAHYQLASLNFGISCGNIWPAHVSPWPFLSLRWRVEANKLSKLGIFEPYQFPWATKKQKSVWNDSDDYKEIESQYQAYLAEQ